MPRLRIAKQAKHDLLEIWVYIARDSVKHARRFDSLLRQKFRGLAKMPGLGRSRDELGSDCRSFPVGNYVVLYRHQRSIVEILKVIHGASDLDELLGPGAEE